MAEVELRTRAVGPAAAQQPGTPPRLVTVTMLTIAGLEAALFAVAAAGMLGPFLALGIHLVLVVALAWVLRRQISSGSDGGVALMGLLGTLATGPFGAACAVLLPSLAAADRASSARLGAWYDRIALSSEQDDFTRMSDRIAIGRTVNLAAPAPLELMQAFRDGGTSVQQTALGMIARNFHPDYLAVLKIALDSPEPVVRVQAAAVAARVRDILKRQIEPMIARAAAPELPDDAALALAADLQACANSGLLEEGPRGRAARTCTGLRARTFARLDATARVATRQAPARITAAVADDYLAHLLVHGRFDDFRAARTRAHIPVSGRYRQRRLVLRAQHNFLSRFKAQKPALKSKNVLR